MEADRIKVNVAAVIVLLGLLKFLIYIHIDRLLLMFFFTTTRFQFFCAGSCLVFNSNKQGCDFVHQI